ncbi:MAG: helix-turn-helix transcriptional regulator [Alphaproteobacteria bacterium]
MVQSVTFTMGTAWNICALDIEEVIEKLGIGRTKLYAMMKNGAFPRPI